MSGKKGMRGYPVAVKLEAVRQYLKEGKAQAEITQALGICSPGWVKVSVRQYRREGELAFLRPQGRPRKEADEHSRAKQLELGLALLKYKSHRVAKEFARETQYRVI